MERQHGKWEKRCSAGASVRQHVRYRLGAVVLVGPTVFFVVVCQAFPMHLGMFFLEWLATLRRQRLPRHSERLAKERQQQDYG